MKKAQIIYDSLLDRILTGDLRESDVLTEAGLVEAYEVSKSPVREALVMLCNENILMPVPRLGYRLIPLTPEDVHEVIEMRGVLELHLFDKIIDSLTDEAIRGLREIHEHNLADEKVHKTVKDHWRRNQDFHLYLAGLAANTYMVEALQKTLQILLRASTHYFLGRTQYVEIHEEIMASIEARDFKQARVWLEQDICQILT